MSNLVMGKPPGVQKSKPLSTFLLNKENTITFRGGVNEKSVAKFGDRLLKMSAKAKEDATFYLILDSPGGSIYSGLSFISLMQSVPQKIHCIALFAASMAHSILQACPGKRYVSYNNGVIMIHRAKGMFMGQFNNGEVESQLVFWRKLVGKMEKDNASRMKYEYKYYQARAKDEWWCSTKQCVTERFADDMVKLRCDASLLKLRIKIKRGYYYSGCPLIRSPLGNESNRAFPFR